MSKRITGGKESSSLFRSMATLVLGTGMGRLIAIASIPILTRIYAPADYGVLSVYSSLVAIIAPVISLRYILAVPLPRTDAAAINIFALSAVLALAMTILIAVLFWAFSNTLFSWMSMQILASWWWLVVLGGLAVAFYEAMSLWATRRRAYKIIAQTKVVQAIMGEAIKLVMGLLHIKPFGLLLGQLVERSGGTGAFMSRFWPDFKRNIHYVRKGRIRVLARYYQGFPIYRLPSQFLLVFSTQAPAMFAAALYGAQTTGQLGLALMALALPSNLIGTSIGQVFYGEVARLKKGSEALIKELAILVQKRLLIAGVMPTVIILFFGELIFHVIFGKKWMAAGHYASILSPYVLLQLTSAPLVQIFNIYNAQAAFLIINVVRTLGLIAIYWICSNRNLPATQFTELLSGFLFLFYLFITFYVFHVVNKASRMKSELQNTSNKF